MQAIKVPSFYPQGQWGFKTLQQPEHDTQPLVSDYKCVVQPQTVWALVDEFMLQELFWALLSAGSSLDCLSYVYHTGNSQGLWKHLNPHNLLWDHLKNTSNIIISWHRYGYTFCCCCSPCFSKTPFVWGRPTGQVAPMNSNKVNSIKAQQAKFRIVFKGIGPGDTVCVQISVPNR